MLIGDSDTLSQTLDLELFAGAAEVNVLDVVGRSLEVARGVVALRDEEVVLLAILERLVDGDGGALKVYVSKGFCGWISRNVYPACLP